MIALVGCVFGIISAAIFQKLTDTPAVRVCANRMIAHVLEFRLFIDEPQTVFKSQRDLLTENLNLLRILAAPVLLTTATFGVLYWPVDRYLARAALPVGTTVLITQTADTAPVFPPGVAMDTPPVRIAGTQTWRLRVTDANNSLSHQPWLTTFFLTSALSAGAYAIFPMARETPNKVTP